MSTKDCVLSLLEKSKGEAISGSEIALQLELSRTAVWKAVKALQAEGHIIEATSNKGYTLTNESNLISLQGIVSALNSDTIFNNIIIEKSLGSTNDEAKLLGHKNAPSGTVVIAEAQTDGKGRMGRSFYSPKAGGIYMSVLLRPTQSAAQTLIITAAAAVAVCRAIEKAYGVYCQIKWVNDIYLNGKKLVGILTEASMNFETGLLQYLVAGIGVNITTNDFPQEISEVATALQPFCKLPISRSFLIGVILNELSDILKDLEEKSFLEEYKSRSCVLDKKICILRGNAEKEIATAIDINEQGHLVVKRESDGEIYALNSGEISIRPI